MSTPVCPTCGQPAAAEVVNQSRMAEQSNYARAHRTLHELWTAAVGQPGYDKPKWRELDNAIYMLATDGPGPLKGGAPAA